MLKEYQKHAEEVTPEKIADDIATNKIISISCEGNPSLLKIQELAKEKIGDGVQELRLLSPNDLRVAYQTYNTRKNKAESGKNGKVIVMPSLEDIIDQAA